MCYQDTYPCQLCICDTWLEFKMNHLHLTDFVLNEDSLLSIRKIPIIGRYI